MILSYIILHLLSLGYNSLSNSAKGEWREESEARLNSCWTPPLLTTPVPVLAHIFTSLRPRWHLATCRSFLHWFIQNYEEILASVCNNNSHHVWGWKKRWGVGGWGAQTPRSLRGLWQIHAPHISCFSSDTLLQHFIWPWPALISLKSPNKVWFCVFGPKNVWPSLILLLRQLRHFSKSTHTLKNKAKQGANTSQATKLEN